VDNASVSAATIIDDFRTLIERIPFRLDKNRRTTT
jgi:hypothetical protein